MNNSSVPQNNIQNQGPLNDQPQARRQSSRREWVGKRHISKRNYPRKIKHKVSSKSRHSSDLSVNADCHAMQIEETTQQGLNCSGSSEQVIATESKDYSSLGFNKSDKDRNSNFFCQRIFQYTEYLPQIQSYIVQSETKYIPKAIADSNTITESSRTKLISWVFELSSRFQFKLETSFSAANIIDRTLGLLKISVDKLPLLGITALFMATKYQQILIPNLSSFVGVVPQVYKITNESILRLQGIILNLLSFDLGYVTPILFINYYQSKLQFSHSIKDRSIATAKQMLLSSTNRYLPSSKIACLAISTVQSTCPLTKPVLTLKSNFMQPYKTETSIKVITKL